MKTIKINESGPVKGGGSHPSGRKPKNLKSLPITKVSPVKGGGSGPIYKP
jgi:hypothetical protein